MVPAAELTEKIVKALGPRSEVLEAYLFGSQVRGDTHTHSDIDVAVYLDRDRAESSTSASGFGTDAEIATDLMSILGSDRVDVVVLNRAGPVLYHRVLRDGIRVLARDLKATTRREGLALSRYCDYVPQL